MIILGLILFVLNALLGLVVVFNKRSLVNIVFGFVAFGCALWVLSIYATLATSSLFWSRAAFLGAILGIGFIFLFSVMFPKNKKLSPLKTFLLLLPTLFFAIISCTDLLVKTVTVQGNMITGTFGPLMFFYRIFIPLSVLASFLILFKKYLTLTNSFQRLQIKFVFLGIGAFIVPAIFTNVILPLWFDVRALNSIGPVFSVLMVGFISYAIIRHQLLDIKIVIQRGVIYSALLTLVVGTYLSLVFILGYFFKEVGDSGALWSAGITTVVGIFGVPPLKRYFQKITDKIFFKDTYDYAKVMQELSDVLNKNIISDVIVERSAHILQNNLRIRGVSFLEKKVRAQENTMDAGLVFPIIINDITTGWLAIKEKLSGDPFSETDMRLLTTFTSQVAVALEKARLYEQVHEYSRDLEKKVAERTAQITTLQQDQERMMLDISHGLQTPLTIMKGELWLIKKEGYDNKKIETLDRSIDRISTFVYQLLSLAHLDTSDMDFKMEKINMSDLVEGAALDLFSVAQEKDILLTRAITPGIITTGRKDKLEDLVANIIGNAIKYMRPEGKKLIHVELYQTNAEIILTVRDTGVGIEKKDLPYIFDRFYRARSHDTHGTRGAGLGLAICKKIVDLHNGTIQAESKVGKSTLFTITFPC